MKTLHLRTIASIGPGSAIGPLGLRLAAEQGRAVNLGVVDSASLGQYAEEDVGAPIRFARLFHGPLITTLVTAYAFCGSKGLGYTPDIMLIINNLGGGSLLGAIETPAYRAALRQGSSSIEAVEKAYGGKSVVHNWANIACSAVRTMFDRMEKDEIALGFFHSPHLELAASVFIGGMTGPTGWERLAPLEGLIFTCDGANNIHVTGKICVTQDAKT